MSARLTDDLLTSVLEAIPFCRHDAIPGRVIASRLGLTRLRTVGEAVSALIQLGVPISSTASKGYWRAASAEEIEVSLRESEQRARATLRRRRMLRRALAVFRGQTEIGARG